MISLTVGCGIAVLILSMALFNRELNDSKHNKVEAATKVMENEIEEMKVKAQVAAFGITMPSRFAHRSRVYDTSLTQLLPAHPMYL